MLQKMYRRDGTIKYCTWWRKKHNMIVTHYERVGDRVMQWRECNHIGCGVFDFDWFTDEELRADTDLF
jgi:hypothetical protein